MANILLTEKCIRKCPYCFAKKHMKDTVSKEMNWSDFLYVIDFLDYSGEKRVSLLGGEPTLNKNFIEYVLYLNKRGFFVTVFTSGILTNNIYHKLSKIISSVDNKYLCFVVNINENRDSKNKDIIKQIDFLKTFSKYITISFNVYRIDFNLQEIIELINRYTLDKHIRLGLAQPIPNENNLCLKIDDLPEFADRISSFFPILEKMGITIGFDCGVPLCIFNNEQLGYYFKVSKNRMNFGCGPAIDIGPNLEVWSCFPLSTINKKSLYDFKHLKEIDDFYRNTHIEIRKNWQGIYHKCNTCTYLINKLCSGGCSAQVINVKNIT